MTDYFIAPPFSVLDTRQGYWQERARQWKSLGIQSELGRGDDLTFSGLQKVKDNYGYKELKLTSIFDPVLCELIYKWFCTDSGKVYDCFAGGSVRGIVADKLGYDYTGIELRKEQVEANEQNAAEIGVSPLWICDDSLNADKYINDNSVDLIFSCPPYADLEVYSDDERDISNMDYPDFCKTYKDIISVACRKLKQNRFAVFVVGEVRDKKGIYRNFIDYTKQCFIDNGCNFYNDIVLINCVGTAAIRAKRQFNAKRKVVKQHQNVLVFYKGDVNKISEIYPEIELSDELFEIDGD